MVLPYFPRKVLIVGEPPFMQLVFPQPWDQLKSSGLG